MGKEEELKRVIKLITLWITEIKVNNCVNFYDINKVAEDLSRRILNEIYGYQLENLNYEKDNYPGIGLGKIGLAPKIQQFHNKCLGEIARYFQFPCHQLK